MISALRRVRHTGDQNSHIPGVDRVLPGSGCDTYIELKSRMTTEQVQTLMQFVEEAGMTDRAVWISFTWNLRMLQDVVATNPEAEVGLLSNGLANTTVAMAKTLQTGQNRVFWMCCIPP